MTDGREPVSTPCAACGMALAESEVYVCESCESFFALGGVEVSEQMRSESDD